MTGVKICGITRVEDALLASGLGAAAIGFVFWPRSPRHVTADEAHAIGSELPPTVQRVGVFVDQPVEGVIEIAWRARLDVVQLHGSEDAAYIGRMPCAVWKAVPVTAAFEPSGLDRIPPGATVLLDAHDPVKRGGTGRTVDWSLAAAAARRRPVVLSGGLRPENVRDAIATVRPWAVDISSGVETAPGVKSHDRLRELFAAITHD